MKNMSTITFKQNLETVKCEECKCLLEKRDAQEVDFRAFMVDSQNYYCEVHRKPYSSVTDFVGKKYFGEVEMDKDGTPIGYVKIQGNPEKKKVGRPKKNV